MFDDAIHQGRNGRLGWLGSAPPVASQGITRGCTPSE